MPLSVARARRHISHYKSALLGRCAKWPAYIFHACPVETAVEILRAGELRCRASIPQIERDVANQEALNNNPGVENYVRFYFRPRTRFHIRTEGIKWATHNYRLDHHMSVPIMLLFDAETILTRAGTGFTEQTYAGQGVQPAFDDAGFNRIVFDDVYHDAAPPRDRRETIWARRMAEVVVPTMLPIEEGLEVILCRTQYDLKTLHHLLGPDLGCWQQKIKFQKVPETYFMHWAMYLESISPTANGISIKIKPPSDPY